MLMKLRILDILGKEEQNPAEKLFVTKSSAMCEVEMIDFCAFLNSDILHLSDAISKKPFLKTGRNGN